MHRSEFKEHGNKCGRRHNHLDSRLSTQMLEVKILRIDSDLSYVKEITWVQT
jgi:hypothetical protein